MDAAAPLSVSALLARLEALRPAVAVHRAAMERERRLPAELFAAIADAGLLRLWLPRALGGAELAPVDFMAVVEAAAALDGSVGWIIGNGGGMGRAGGYLPEAIARPWFADPRAFIVAVTGAVGEATPCPGGFHVRGRWPFASGIHHASHVMVLCQRMDGADEQPALLCCYMDARAAGIIDNWHVSGLRGTGSCDLTVSDVFVPVEQCHAFPAIPATQPGVIYRLPAFSAFAWTVATVPLGIAAGAMATFARMAEGSVRSGRGDAMREREAVQSAFGELRARHMAARALLADTMTQLCERTAVSTEDPLQARLNLRLACVHATDTAVAIVEALARLAGTASIRETGTLERAMRDVHAAARHRAMSPDHYITGGRAGLGLDLGTVRI